MLEMVLFGEIFAFLVRAANSRLLGFFRLDQRNDVRNLPKLVSDANGHCRGHAQRSVNAYKIVIHEMQGNRVGVGLDLL
jgi:hypothetical protein